MYTYEHGGYMPDEEKEYCDLSININPLGLPDSVTAAVQGAIAACVRYPDPFCKQLRTAIAAFEDSNPENIICGNGASDLLFRLIFFLKPRQALLLAPCFADYKRALGTVGCQVQHYFLSKESGFLPGNDFFSLVRQIKPDLIIVTNPNNPTGCVLSRSWLDALVQTTADSGSNLLIDECFIDFLPKGKELTLVNRIPDNDHLFVVKALTKSFAMPGLRLGYLIHRNRERLAALLAQGPDWQVSTLAQIAGIAALETAVWYLPQTEQYVVNEKIRLFELFHRCGFQVYGSQANFIFFSAPDYPDLKEELWNNHKILVRSCRNFRGLDEPFYRIGIGRPEQNQAFIQALGAITKINQAISKPKGVNHG